MEGEQSVNSYEASEFRRILEASPINSYSSYSPPTDASDTNSHINRNRHEEHGINPINTVPSAQESRATQTKDFPPPLDTHNAVSSRDQRSKRRHRSRSRGRKDGGSSVKSLYKVDKFEKLSSTQLQVLLTRADERLSSESKRAIAAEQRAKDAETHALTLVKEIFSLKQEATTEKAKRAAYQAQVEQAKKEITKAQEHIDSLSHLKQRAEEDAARDRSYARKARHDMEIQHAVDVGRQEGFARGWSEGSKAGRRRAIQQAQDLGYFDLLPPDQPSGISARTSAASYHPPGQPPTGSSVLNVPPAAMHREPSPRSMMPDPSVVSPSPVPGFSPGNPDGGEPSPLQPPMSMPEPQPYTHPAQNPGDSTIRSPIRNTRASSRASNRSGISVPVQDLTSQPMHPPAQQPSPVPAQQARLLEPEPITRPKSPRPDVVTSGIGRSTSRPASRVSIIESEIPIADNDGTFTLPPPHALASTLTSLSPKLRSGEPGVTSGGIATSPRIRPPSISIEPPSNEASSSRYPIELVPSRTSPLSSGGSTGSDFPPPIPPPKSPRSKGPPPVKKGRRTKSRPRGDSGSDSSSWDFMEDGGNKGTSDNEDRPDMHRTNSPRLSVIHERPMSETSRPPTHSPALPHNAAHHPQTPAASDREADPPQLNAATTSSRPRSVADMQFLQNQGSRPPSRSAPQMLQAVSQPPSYTSPVGNGNVPHPSSRGVSPAYIPWDSEFIPNASVQETLLPSNGPNRQLDLAAIDEGRSSNNASVLSGSTVRRASHNHHVKTPIMPSRLGTADGLAYPTTQRKAPSQDVQWLEDQVRSESVSSARDDERSVAGRQRTRPSSININDMPSITVQAETPPEQLHTATPIMSRRHSPNVYPRSPLRNIPFNNLLSPVAGGGPSVGGPPPVIEPAPTPPEELTDPLIPNRITQDEFGLSGFPAGFVPVGPPHTSGGLGRTPARGNLRGITPARIQLPLSVATAAGNLPAEGSNRYSYEAAPPDTVPGNMVPRQTPHEGRRKSLIVDGTGQPPVVRKTPFSRPQQLSEGYAGNYSTGAPSGHTPAGSSRIMGMTPAAGRSNLSTSGNAAMYSAGAPLETATAAEALPVLPGWQAPPHTGRTTYTALSKKTPGVVTRGFTDAGGHVPRLGYGRTPAHAPTTFQGESGSLRHAAGVALPSSSRVPSIMLGKTPAAKSQRRLSEGFAGNYDVGGPLPPEAKTPARSIVRMPAENNAASYDAGAPVAMGTPLVRSNRTSNSGLYGSPIFPDTIARNTPGAKSQHFTPMSGNRQLQF